MTLKADVEGGRVWAAVYNVPEWITCARDLYEAIEEGASNPDVARWLELSGRSPGFWLNGGTTFLAKDEI